MMSDILYNLLFLVFSVLVSLIFWIKDSNKGFLHFFISIHSILLLITLVAVMYIGLELHLYNNIIVGGLFALILMISVASIFFSFEYFTGSSWYHLLHLWNVFLLLFTIFIGMMSLTNDWL